ncbi:glycosyltransferase family 39 protein [bacterium]|nr:glycosyltransferase family 39 protein [bacterium]
MDNRVINRERRCSRLGLGLLLLGLWAALVLSQCTSWVFMSPDAGRYLALARSLAEGDGYRLDERFCRFYPPAFPWMLSVLRTPTDTGYLRENAFVAATALGALLASALLLAQRHRGRRLAVLAALVALSPTFVRLAATVRSDVPFLLFSSAFLLCVTRFWRADTASWRLAAASALTLALGAMTRSVAVAFYGAAFLWLARPGLWRRRRRHCLLFAGAMLLACAPVVAWQAAAQGHRDDGTVSYAGGLRHTVLGGHPLLSAEGLERLLARQAETAPHHLNAAVQTLVRSRPHDETLWLTLLLAPVLLTGLATRLRRCELPDLCFCGYALLIVLWPTRADTRFWLPLLPLLLGYLADGLSVLARFRGASALAMAGAALLLAGAGVASARLALDHRTLGDGAVRHVVLKSSRRALVRYIDSLEAPAVLAYSQHNQITPALGSSAHRVIGIPWPSGRTDKEVAAALVRRRITHVAFDKRTESIPLLAVRDEEVLRIVDSRPDRFRLVHNADDVRIYQVLYGP